MFQLPKNIDKSWTLFLDRDGVINEKLDNNYVKKWSEFKLIEGVEEALVHFSELFGCIIIVTNQQGIGKKLMLESDLHHIHEKMLDYFRRNGITINAIMHCPHLASDNCNCRKPKTEMGLKAKEFFPHIDFKKSVLIGDSKSDIEFGTNLGMHTIFIERGKKLIDLV